MDEVLKAVAGVNWRTLGKWLLGEEIEHQMIRYTNLDRIRDKYKSDEARLRAVVETSFLKLGRSWRTVIWTLYCFGEIDKAQQISSYAEPLQGMCCAVKQLQHVYEFKQKAHGLTIGHILILVDHMNLTSFSHSLDHNQL